MTRLWTILGVRDVRASYQWYQHLLGVTVDEPAHGYFGMVCDRDGTVLVCLHAWGAHEHPPLTNADLAAPGHGLLLFFRVDDHDGALARTQAMGATLVEAPHRNPNTGTLEFSLRDPDGYYVTISAS